VRKIFGRRVRQGSEYDPEAVKKGDRQKTVLSIPYKSTSGTGDNSRGLPPDTRAAPEGQ